MKPERLNRESGTDMHSSSLRLHPFGRVLGVLGGPFGSPRALSFRASPTSRVISQPSAARSGQALRGFMPVSGHQSPIRKSEAAKSYQEQSWS